MVPFCGSVPSQVLILRFKFFQEITFVWIWMCMCVCVCVGYVCVLRQMGGENTWLWGLEKDLRIRMHSTMSPVASPRLHSVLASLLLPSEDAGRLTHAVPASAGAQHITPSALLGHCSFIHSHLPSTCYHLLPPIASCFVLLVLISFHFINFLPPSQWLFKQERRYTFTGNHPHLTWSPLDSLHCCFQSSKQYTFQDFLFPTKESSLDSILRVAVLQQNSTITCLLGWQLSSLSR